MDASKRMMLAKAMKEARAAKAGASSAPAADPIPPPTLSLPPPITAETPLGSSPPSPHSPEALQTSDSPLPIAAVPLAAASSPAPTPLEKGKRVLEILSDDEDSEGVAPFKRRKSAGGSSSGKGVAPGRELLHGQPPKSDLTSPHDTPRGRGRRRRICPASAAGRSHCFLFRPVDRDVFVRDLNRQLGTPSHWLPVDSCKKEDKKAP